MNCVICGNKITISDARRKTCSDKCRDQRKKDKAKEISDRWMSKNKDKHKESCDNWRKKNKDKLKEQMSDYYYNNRDKILKKLKIKYRKKKKHADSK